MGHPLVLDRMDEVLRIFRKPAPAAAFRSAFTATGITSVPPLVHRLRIS
jgi:hypothetical protein